MPSCIKLLSKIFITLIDSAGISECILFKAVKFGIASNWIRSVKTLVFISVLLLNNFVSIYSDNI